jgi:hypothetical protein
MQLEKSLIKTNYISIFLCICIHIYFGIWRGGKICANCALCCLKWNICVSFFLLIAADPIARVLKQGSKQGSACLPGQGQGAHMEGPGIA